LVEKGFLLLHYGNVGVIPTVVVHSFKIGEASVAKSSRPASAAPPVTDPEATEARRVPARARRPRGNAGGGAAPSRRPAPLLPGAEPNLPPTARRLLDAAHRLLARSGYNSLTVEAIGREAGENKALIRYYFGSKNGLLIALTDSLILQTLGQTRRRLSGLSDTRDRVAAVADAAEEILADEAAYRLLFDLLPRLLENPSMARQLADLYRGYREINARALWGDSAGDPPAVVRELAAMTVALTDGLAVQVLAEPDSVDVRSALATWRSLVQTVLESALESAAQTGPGAGPGAACAPAGPEAPAGAATEVATKGAGGLPPGP
jgi:AcrR family transcriptional regulator